MTVGGELLGNGLYGIVSRFGVSPTLLGNTARSPLGPRPRRSAASGSSASRPPGHGRRQHQRHRDPFPDAQCRDSGRRPPLHPDDATMHFHLPAAVVAPALYCLIRFCAVDSADAKACPRRFYVAYVAAAVRAVLGMVG